AFEAGRVSIVGPTVDAIHLDAFYGVVAFVVGRVFHGVLVLLPLEVGVSHGAWLASRAGHPRATSPGRLRWALTAVGSLATVALAAAVARPAATAPIVGADGEPIAGWVAEVVGLPIGGHHQMLMIRGGAGWCWRPGWLGPPQRPPSGGRRGSRSPARSPSWWVSR